MHQWIYSSEEDALNENELDTINNGTDTVYMKCAACTDRVMGFLMRPPRLKVLYCEVDNR